MLMNEAPKSIGPAFFGGDHDTRWEPLKMDFHHNDDHFRICEPAYDEIFEHQIKNVYERIYGGDKKVYIYVGLVIGELRNKPTGQ